MARPAVPVEWATAGLAAGAVAATGLFKTAGGDIWWHVRTGQWIWENGSIPDRDVFSHTAAGPLRYTEWLAQLYFYAAHAAGGAEGVVWANVVLLVGLAALVLALLKQAGATPAVASLLLGVWGLAAAFRFVAKPHSFSDLGFVALLLVLRRADRSRSTGALLWLVPGMLVWSNLHRGATLGLWVLCAAIVAWTLDRSRRAMVGPAAAVTALCAAAVCVNPGGVRYLSTAFSLYENAAFQRHLLEWSPLGVEFLHDDAPVFGAMVLVWWAGFVLRRRRLDLDALVVIGTTVLAQRSLRFIPFAAIAMLPGLASDLHALLAHLPRPRAHVRPALYTGLAAALGAGAVARHYVATWPPSLRGPGVAHWQEPMDAAAFLAANPPPGRMWNNFNLGGYLLFALSPGQKVFIDGRNDTVYDATFFDTTARAVRDPDRMRGQLAHWDIGYAVTEYGNGGADSFAAVRRSAAWALVYWDDVAAVHVRRSDDAAAYLAAHAYRTLQVDTTLERLARWTQEAEKEALLADLARNAREAPRSIRAQFALAVASRVVGDSTGYTEARERAGALAVERDLDLSERWPR